MSANRFLDTNILLYATIAEDIESDKADRAVSILQSDNNCLSVQVLQEFYFQATHERRRKKLNHETAVRFINGWKRFPIQTTTVQLVDRALEARELWGLSYWDAAIIEAARMAGCREVISEDMADGQDYGGVCVINPFRR